MREEPAATAYEVIYDCRNRALGQRLAKRLQDVARGTWKIRRLEDGPTWSITIEFPSPRSADDFFDSDLYRQFCVDARRSCRSSVLVVPLGPVDGTD